MTYELIGRPRVEIDYSGEFETVMTFDLRRSDGVTGTEVWIVAGVPDYNQGSARAAGHQTGFEDVRVFGDSHSTWCPVSFEPADGDYRTVADEICAAVRSQALAVHREQRENFVMTPEDARQLLNALFPDADPDDIDTYIDGPDNSEDYFSKIANVDELRADFAEFLGA